MSVDLWPQNRKELDQILDRLEHQAHDYNSAPDAMRDAALAAFNYMASQVGATGFQAAWAQLDFIRKSRNIDGPFIVIKLDDYLYPQFNLQGQLTKFIEDNNGWIKKQANKYLDDADSDYAVEAVREHWKKLADA